MELTKLAVSGLSLYGIAFRGGASDEKSRQLAAKCLTPALASWTKTDSITHGLESSYTEAGELA